ncbi:MAG: hypothetical protein Q4G04_00510 [bacterium]|nr:hypothetical protein [bacterium]
MINNISTEQLREVFKKIYIEEFEDPNESFMDFLLDLISRNDLIKVLKKGNRYYYSIFKKYK